MLKSVILAGACSVSFLIAPAFAQAAKPDFVTRQSTNEWRASKLVGIDVYGTDNKKIGSIEDVMMTPQGNAKVVVIGVGGFLGMGEKNVGVPFSSLTWKREAEGRTAATTNGSATPSPAVAAAQRGYPDHAILAATKTELTNAPSFKFASNSTASGMSSSTVAPAKSTGSPAMTPASPAPATNK